ncbi:MAG: 4-hydroxy-tetrahydrodipicolinate reductase [Lachnospiraceae bacterium]|nr:4-hydroxy-tetrahydrodipicolinate reductase [Lachnospiraceae bacterium]
MIKAVMHGCNGRMGRMIASLVKEDPDIEITAGVDAFQSDEKADFPVFESMAACTADADVVIDFSNAAAVDGLLCACTEKKLPLVLCTTGLSEEQLRKVEDTAKQIPILKAANMSLGINLMMDLLKKAVSVLYPAGFDVEIVERHHNQKLDAPSGTALALADAMNEEMDEIYQYTFDRSKERKKRERAEIGISAVRGGNIVGEHTVIFAGGDEVVEIKHTATSRAVFGKGAIEAAKWLSSATPGLYDMSDVIAGKGRV